MLLSKIAVPVYQKVFGRIAASQVSSVHILSTPKTRHPPTMISNKLTDGSPCRAQPNPSRFPGGVALSSSATVSEVDISQLEQLEDSCIVVDADDNVIGQDTKRNCHYLPNNPKGILHRAFSVFLFNSKNELLLQQRSMAKITFPGYFTNSCCSHPTYSADEMEAENAIGIKRAAQRRLATELGIGKSELPLDCFRYVTRLHYCSPSNGDWGEHEIDYVLFVKRDVVIRGNSDEVMHHCYVAQDKIAAFLENLKKNGTPITPWFRLIVDNLLMNWWTNLDRIESLADHQTIHRYT